jgi:hypothetical protein
MEMNVRRCVTLTCVALAASIARPCAAESATGQQRERRAGWGLDLEAAAGMGVLATASGADSVGLVGGQARFRTAHFELGAFADTARVAVHSAGAGDDAATARTFGGFAGLWLSRRSAADLDFALGLGRRSYARDALATAVLEARLGVSARNGARLGERVGARLVLSWDLHTRERPFTRTVPPRSPASLAGDEPVVFRDKRHTGGVTVVLMLTLAIDVEP